MQNYDFVVSHSSRELPEEKMCVFWSSVAVQQFKILCN